MTTIERTSNTANWPLGLLGAAAGGAIGFVLFKLILSQGFYAMALPGAVLGWGCGKLSGGYSQPLGIVCGVLALVLSLLLEWHFFPFIANGSFGFFLKNIHELKPMTLLMIALGTAAGYWFGMGRERGTGA